MMILENYDLIYEINYNSTPVLLSLRSLLLI